jgi:hypothetical protein
MLLNLSFYRDKKEDMELLTPRSAPRRIVHGLPVNHEFDLFQARMHILGGRTIL